MTRVGVVGAGYWGPNLIRNCAALGALAAVCDVDERALGQVRASYPSVATTSDYAALLRRPLDAVIIAAPAQLHAEMCMQAIAAGKHVFVEKPLALTVREGEQIVAAAEAAKAIVFVGHLLLYHPAVVRLRELLAQGAVGPVWHVRSRRLSLGKLRAHESVWWSFAPHDVALALALMGEEPLSAAASQSSARPGGRADVAYADFSFSGERSAHIEVCWLDPDRSARLDVFGTTGSVALSDSRTGTTLVVRRFAVAAGERGAPVVTRGDETVVQFGGDEPLRVELSAFLEAVRTGHPAETDARHGVAVLRALSMADEALHSRSPVHMGVPA